MHNIHLVHLFEGLLSLEQRLIIKIHSSIHSLRSAMNVTDSDMDMVNVQRITDKQNKVVITDRMWARLLSSTNQPSFLTPKDVVEEKKEEETITQLLLNNNTEDDTVSNPSVTVK